MSVIKMPPRWMIETIQELSSIERGPDWRGVSSDSSRGIVGEGHPENL
jgi:hypothetical protein